MLASYTSLRETITTKNRGRKHEALVLFRPAVWGRMVGENIGLFFKGGRVGTLRPDNSLTVDINGWHTPTSVKIIRGITGLYAGVHRNHIWVANTPIQFNEVNLTPLRYYILPEHVAKFASDVLLRQQAVTLKDMAAPARLLLEMKEWVPIPCLSAKVKEYLRGNLPKSALGRRDIYTLCDHSFMRRTMAKMMEDLA